MQKYCFSLLRKFYRVQKYVSAKEGRSTPAGIARIRTKNRQSLTFCKSIMEGGTKEMNDKEGNHVVNAADEVSDKKKEKKAKKLAEKEKKLAKKAERENLKNEATKILEHVCEDIEKDNYGFVKVSKIKENKDDIKLLNLEEIYYTLMKVAGNATVDNGKREDTSTPSVVAESGKEHLLQGDIWVRGRIHDIRSKGSLAFIILRQKLYSMQCILDIKNNDNDKNMMKWVSNLPLESIVDIYGKLTKPEVPIDSTNIKYEVHIKKIFCISKTTKELPFLLKDANMKETNEEGSIKVNQDNRLNNRCIDLRTYANYSIFCLQSQICTLFKNFLLKNNFIEIHTPKLLGESSEGGANAFQINYFNQKGFLAQSPQLYKQMCINSGFDRVFEVAPVFRAENSNTYRHLCEYVSLDIEMTYKYDFLENVFFYDSLFKHIFTELTKGEKSEMLIKTVKGQYPCEDFQWLEVTPIFTYEEAIKMLIQHNKLDLKDEDILSYDMSTDMEKELGKIVKASHHTDYYIIINFPSALRPFYTMYKEDNPAISNSYDFFMRGEEILSGSQRISDVNLLLENIKRFNLDASKLNFYIDSFAYSSYPHSGCGIGLERVLMLFLGLNNIRKTSLFPRDPKRLIP
ncbi:aspartate--tRNA ligase, putative [Plasmodium knowlesi strain H]|uniref:aspartate--tRNA ligase n=3 Tax=Plasmodium knowlesi TaxID=5850 RepID=A0A5K1UJW3_PLAKH|nr:aspartate--tRNA ligase, putative [Plasmodium knowlesi strain H]OTN66370.1 putative Aspartate--tRNA ligase [Plasmodium knowlesi]CAA9986373.1 aspartate--tRNA ligase, putative [Plasmodium knowlesi strain H]SBO25637.1 aspartate--tRNA ligase, putative [Plasmodium knowlesi strain H]SBO28359.1 aspartate--tRNA ligase, putative [Plasmodium knowlesi strain H]VVS75847.1 aspartate--tRNA ligase, putative [Plasmodium knowlesi strain H]|eukprot:XP_002257779.1 Aspartate--tRNA ligase, putative [Plasmodium knowlesi strain H]